MHAHSGPVGIDGALWVFALPYAVAVGAYLGAMVKERRKGRGWPWLRGLLWMLGCTTALTALLGPLTTDLFTGFAGHMVAHVLIGMVAPLFLVLAAPITLALRTLDVLPARRISRIFRSTPIRVLTMPVVAATINIGSMWVLYLTPLHELADVPMFHLLLMAHFLLAGMLFTASIACIDPNPHRASFPTRVVVLVVALAAHGMLSKLLYGHPPHGASAGDVELGSQLMFYAGDLVDLALMGLLLAQWYRTSGRRSASPTTVEDGAGIPRLRPLSDRGAT